MDFSGLWPEEMSDPGLPQFVEVFVTGGSLNHVLLHNVLNLVDLIPQI
jgi:hypothetical protein